MDFSELDKQYDVAGILKDAEEASQSSGFEGFPDGQYEVALDDIEATFSKKDKKPMVCFKWAILSGRFKGQTIYQYKVLLGSVKVDKATGLKRDTTGYLIHQFNEFCGNVVDKEIPYKFTCYSDVPELVKKIKEHAQKNFEYCLEIKTGKGDFKEYKIAELYEKD